MKRILSLVLVVLMCASALILSACGKKGTSAPAGTTSPTPGDTTASSTPSKNNVGTDDDGNTPNDIFKNLVVTSSKTEHKKYEGTLPSSSTLVGSDTLPPIDNRNGINCQAAEAVTYMQYTNAIARYIQNKGTNSNWKPSLSSEYRFSPKSTFFGTSAAASYDMLRDNGAYTKNVDDFGTNASGSYMLKKDNQYVTKTVNWRTEQGAGEEALKYRLLKYEPINTSNTEKQAEFDGYYDPTSKGVKITNSQNGQALLEKIKDAIATGNVVVGQGYSDRWIIEKLGNDSGTLGKKNDSVITYATNATKELYQIAIVGYDDDLEITTCGVTLKGAFLLANCMGTSWGTNGYAWLMYDALNTNSEFEDFKVPEGTTRSWAMDYFYFTYWDVDITEKKPIMYAELELDISNRNAFNIEMFKTDALNRTNFIQSYQTYHSTLSTAPKFDLEKGYFNPNGVENGPSVSGFYTISFERLWSSVPENATIEDFLWGIRVSSTSKDHSVVVKSIKIKNAEGTVVAELDLGEGETITNTKYTYVFDFGKEKCKNFLTGCYTFQNVASKNYLAQDNLMTFKPSSNAKDAHNFILTYDGTLAKSRIFRNDEKYVMDCIVDLNTGAPVQFYAQDDNKRTGTQCWTISYNDDGTFSFYITSEKGTNYALGEVNGVVCLVKATELSDTIKWNVTRVIRPNKDDDKPAIMTKTENGMTLSATLLKSATAATVKVSKLDGSEVLTANATISGKALTAELALKDPGTYIVRIYSTEDDSLLTCCYIITIK